MIEAYEESVGKDYAYNSFASLWMHSCHQIVADSHSPENRRLCMVNDQFDSDESFPDTVAHDPENSWPHQLRPQVNMDDGIGECASLITCKTI
jgi:hypothetical protein